MPTEVLRCTECNAPLKAVPAWLTTAHVKFTCNSCPKRSSRPAAARFDAPVEARTPTIDQDPEVETDEVPDLDEDLEMEVSLESLDEPKDDKEAE